MQRPRCDSLPSLLVYGARLVVDHRALLKAQAPQRSKGCVAYSYCELRRFRTVRVPESAKLDSGGVGVIPLPPDTADTVDVYEVGRFLL
jgi:hypothetical protein